MATSDNASIDHMAMYILAACCNTDDRKAQLRGVNHLVSKIFSFLMSPLQQRKVAALAMLQALSFESPDMASYILKHQTFHRVVNLLRLSNSCINILAARVIANLERTLVTPSLSVVRKIQSSQEQLPTKMPRQNSLSLKHATIRAIHTLITAIESTLGSKLLKEALSSLVYIVGDCEQYHHEAAPVIPRLSAMLTKDAGHTEEVRIEVLLALATLSSKLETLRQQVVEHQAVVPVLTKLLSTPCTSLRRSSCMVLRSLSCPPKAKRERVVWTSVVKPLILLLDDPCIDIRMCAGDTISNLVLDEAEMRVQIIREGVVPTLACLAKSSHPELQANSICVLRNIVYKAENSTKSQVFQHLGFQFLCSLLHLKQSHEILLAALSIFRHLLTAVEEAHISILQEDRRCRSVLVSNDCAAIPTSEPASSHFCLGDLEQLLAILMELLSVVSCDGDILCESIHVLVCIINSNSTHKDLVMKFPKLLEGILLLLASSREVLSRNQFYAFLTIWPCAYSNL